MKKVILAAVMALILVMPLHPAKAAGQPVLLVYRVDSQRQVLSSVLKACGLRVTAVSEADYHADMLSGYDALVTTIRKPYLDSMGTGLKVLAIGPDTLPEEGFDITEASGLGAMLQVGEVQSTVFFSEEVYLMESYQGTKVGELTIPLRGTYPYGIIHGNIAYVPNFEVDHVQPLAIGFVVQQLLLEPAAGRLFLWIDEVYPFSDLGMLCQMADELYKRGYPFTVSAMPVYDNLDYPAYLRYTQVLRYVQSRGGAVIMHDPIIRSAESEAENADVRLARARESFEQQGIILANGLIDPYAISLEALSMLQNEHMKFDPLPMDVALLLPIVKTPEELESHLELLSGKWIAPASLFKMVSDVPYLYNEKSIDDTFAYRAEIETSFESFFFASNQTLIIIVLISLVVFSALLAGGYFLYRRKFYR